MDIQDIVLRDLSFNYQGAYNAGDHRHAQETMKDMGISYQMSIPQSMGDCFWFINCVNVPDNLPSYITDLNIEDPSEYVGWGFSEKMAAEAVELRTVVNAFRRLWGFL